MPIQSPPRSAVKLPLAVLTLTALFKYRMWKMLSVLFKTWTVAAVSKITDLERQSRSSNSAFDSSDLKNLD